MPQVNVVKEELFKYVGKTFSKSPRFYLSIKLSFYPIADEEFEDLCFEFGLEMEMGDGVEMNMARIDGAGNNVDMSKTTVYKVEVPANRYDLLCLEGIAVALRCYLSKDKLPTYKLSKPDVMEKVIVKPSTKAVRPVVVSAILRDIQFDVQSYNSFIDL